MAADLEELAPLAAALDAPEGLLLLVPEPVPVATGTEAEGDTVNTPPGRSWAIHDDAAAAAS
jgi:hypothetical protein